MLHTCAFAREQPRTRRCTIHPCLTTTLTRNTTEHVNSVHIWVSQLLKYSFAYPWMCSVDSLLVNTGMERGRSWSSLDSDVSSGKSAGAIAKDRGWPSSSVSCQIASHCLVQAVVVPSVCWRPLVIRTVPRLEDRHIRGRRKFAEQMLARLALGSGRRIARKISSSRRLILDVICFSGEKVFKVDAAAPGHPFSHICSRKTGAT